MELGRVETQAADKWARSGRHGAAFTLLEMLLVLAVISLTIIIVVPVLARARGNAHRSACFNNIHQCAMAVSLYLEDYDNVYPTYRADPHHAAHPAPPLDWHDHFCRALGTQPNLLSWVSLTRAYTNTRYRPFLTSEANEGDVYHCPNDGDRGAAATSYEFKMLLATGLPLSEVHTLAATTMLWEQWAFHSEQKWSEHDRRAEMNMVFVDGHAAWIRLADTTNARYGSGPDLHWMPTGASIPPQHREEDVAY